VTSIDLETEAGERAYGVVFFRFTSLSSLFSPRLHINSSIRGFAVFLFLFSIDRNDRNSF
jgi:hypothetical protein